MRTLLAGPVLTVGWATAVATWVLWYVLFLPGIAAPPVAIGIVILAVLLLGAAIAGGAAGPKHGWTAGAGAAAVASALGMVILLSYLVEQPAADGGGGGLTPARLLWGVGFLVASALAGAVAGALGGPLARQVRGRWAGGSDDPAFWLSRFAVVTAAAFLPLIIAGGTVTSTGAGLAVEGWPGSDGVAMVLYPVELMSTPRVFFEHSHRLLGLLVGITTIALLLRVWLTRSAGRASRLMTAVLLAFVVVQGVMGGLRVTEGSAALAVVHGILGQLVFGLACATAVVLSPAFQGASASTDPMARRLRLFATGATHVLILQLILGALYRHMTAADSAAPGANHVLYTHAAFSLVVVIFAAVAGFMLRAMGERIGDLHRPLVPLGTGLVAVLAVQFFLGWAALIVLILGDGKSPIVSPAEASTVSTPPLAQTLLTTAHQANGAVLVGCTAAAFTWARRLRPKRR